MIEIAADNEGRCPISLYCHHREGCNTSCPGHPSNQPRDYAEPAPVTPSGRWATIAFGIVAAMVIAAYVVAVLATRP